MNATWRVTLVTHGNENPLNSPNDVDVDAGGLEGDVADV